MNKDGETIMASPFVILGNNLPYLNIIVSLLQATRRTLQDVSDA